MDYDSLLGLVQQRRSIRRFKTEPLPDEYIDKIIEVARWAPSGFNMQPWEFVVVRKPELKAKIAEYCSVYFTHLKAMEQTRESWQGTSWDVGGMTDKESDFTGAPVYILLYGDPRSQAGLPMGVRYDAHRKDLIYTSGLAHAFVYMHLAATTLGLASQWISAVQTAYAQVMIKGLLGIPPGFEIYDMIALGYPALERAGKFIRERNDMVHYDDCGEDDFRSDDEVRNFIIQARKWNMGQHRRVNKADKK